MLSSEEVTQFQYKIFTWYSMHQRDLPWRHTRDPYAILVSEVMSQQTQISRVVPKFDAWMKRFPTVERLASASTRDVLQYWSGLGYNRRALFLKKCAEALVGKQWPQTEKELRQLPGIGEYTARALLCFAFDQQIAVIDTNVKKIILTQFTHTSQVHKKTLEVVAQQLLPVGRAYEWNQALMDYAAAELKKEKIVLPKQSRFHDSDRYYRGQILKYLLKQKTTTREELLVYFQDIPTINANRLEKIITGLLKDSLVLEDSKKMVLSLEE